MREDEVLALVGEDLKLVRDLSGGSFGNLFSDEASRQELAMAMANLTDEVVRSPSFRTKSAVVKHSESGASGSVPAEVAGFEGSQTAAAAAVLPASAELAASAELSLAAPAPTVLAALRSRAAARSCSARATEAGGLGRIPSSSSLIGLPGPCDC